MNKISLQVTLPGGLKIEHAEGKITFVGTMDEISKFAREIRTISKLPDGALASVDKYILKYPTTRPTRASGKTGLNFQEGRGT